MSAFLASPIADATKRWYVLSAPPRASYEERAFIAYDGTGMTPCAMVRNPDGAVELRGACEIRAAADALTIAAALAEDFGQAVSLLRWRRMHDQ